MLRALIFVVLVCSFASWSERGAAADYADGLREFNNGNFSEAARIWGQVADEGDPDAMYRLGQLFRAGKGVPSSQVRAHLYFSLAATRGKSRAAAERDELAATMSAEELARAEELVERLNPLVTDDKELVALAATTAVDEADTTVAIPLRSTPIGGNSVADVDAGPTDAPVAAAAPEVLTVGGWTSTNANGQSENLSDSGISVTGTYNPSTGVVDTELSLGGDTVAVTFDANGAVSVTRGGETFETDLPIVSVLIQ